jgi:hypothetical protein
MMATDLLNASTVALEYCDKLRDIHLTLCDARINSSQILILGIGVLVEGAAVLALGFGASQYGTYRKCVKICSLEEEEKEVAMKLFFKLAMDTMDTEK